MERKTTDLALQGEQLIDLKRCGLFDLKAVRAEISSSLVKHFSIFSEVVGGGVWFEPYTLDKDEKYFGSYAFIKGGGVKFTWNLNTPEYEYFNQKWYLTVQNNDWSRNQERYRPIFWTTPYFDGDGTFVLMITVDAVMFDQNRQPIGMATVDWALSELTRFLDDIKISLNSLSFLIHQQSGQFLSFPNYPQQVMQSATQFEWGESLLKDKLLNKLHSFNYVDNDGAEYVVYYNHTDQGFTFGMLTPVEDMVKSIDMLTTMIIMAGASIGLIFYLNVSPDQMVILPV